MVSVYNIEEAILSFMKDLPEKRSALLVKHKKLSHAWSWKEVLKPLVKLVDHFGG